MFLTDKLQRLIDDFAVVEDPQDRLAAVVDRGRRNPPLPEADRTDANRVRGCVSIVWLVGALRGEQLHFRSDAESPVVRGLLAFLCDFFNDAPIAEVAESELEPLDALQITQNLSPTRRNGLAAARRAIRTLAQQQAHPRGNPSSGSAS